MSDMANEEAAKFLTHWRDTIRNDRNGAQESLTLAIAALQRPVVTREEIARLIKPETFSWAEDPQVQRIYAVSYTHLTLPTILRV